MATTTTNYGLTKPASTDYYNIDVANANNDKIDTTLKSHEDDIAKKLDESGGSASNLTAAFEAASTRTLPATGEKLSVLFGKILKWLSDLGTAALCSSDAFASASHSHAAGDITSGTLAVTRGGTGVTALSTTPTSGSAAPITSGGVYAAIKDKCAISTGTATLSTSSWSGSAAPYSYALAISGLLATDTVIIDCVTGQDASSASAIKAAWALTANYGLDALQAAGQITMYASAKPTINIPVRYTVWR